MLPPRFIWGVIKVLVIGSGSVDHWRLAENGQENLFFTYQESDLLATKIQIYLRVFECGTNDNRVMLWVPYHQEAEGRFLNKGSKRDCKFLQYLNNLGNCSISEINLTIYSRCSKCYLLSKLP